MQIKFFKSHSCVIILVFCFSFIGCHFLEGAIKKNGELQKEYEFRSHNPSDINEHIPLLRSLAKECSSTIEIGVRSFIATWGILQGLTESPFENCSYIGIDKFLPPDDRLEFAKRLAKEKGIDFTFWHVDDLDIEIEPADLLFIDAYTRHTYCHLTHELETFSPKIRKYICLHDTSEPWGDQDDHEYKGDYSEYPSSYDRTKKGLWPAVVDFLEKHPEWTLSKHRTNNHGFTVLKRIDESAVPYPANDPQVDYYIKNKMILCTGPSQGRYDLLKKTTEADLNLIPFKQIYLSTNDQAIMGITFNGRKPVCEYIGDRYKTLDCLNCIFTTMKNAVNDPNTADDDILIFKHETVFINDMGLIKRAVRKMLDGFGMIERNTPYGPGTDVFMVKVSAIRDIVKNYPIITEIPADDFAKSHGVWNAESYFNAYFIERIANVYWVPGGYLPRKSIELGFYHIVPAGDHFEHLWDKKNYHELYK